MTEKRSAVRLEALGATEAVFVFRGRDVTVPLDVETWPAALVRFDPLQAVLVLLGDQAATALGPAAVLDDARELSEAMATAVGITRLPETPAAPDDWFGAVPTLLRILDDHEPDVELDLRRIGVDYRDRWRGQLTLRQIWVYLRRLLPTSATAIADNDGRHVWTEPDFIAASNYQAITGKVYPGRPLKPDELARALEAVQAEANRTATLREREARYAPPTSPVMAAMQQAEENRRRELGLPHGEAEPHPGNGNRSGHGAG